MWWFYVYSLKPLPSWRLLKGLKVISYLEFIGEIVNLDTQDEPVSKWTARYNVQLYIC